MQVVVGDVCVCGGGRAGTAADWAACSACGARFHVACHPLLVPALPSFVSPIPSRVVLISVACHAFQGSALVPSLSHTSAASLVPRPRSKSMHRALAANLSNCNEVPPRRRQQPLLRMAPSAAPAGTPPRDGERMHRRRLKVSSVTQRLHDATNTLCKICAVAGFCCRPADAAQYISHDARSAGWRKDAAAVLKGLMASEDAWMFSEAVPRDVPLYYQIVAHPTDLGAISRRLKSGDFCEASRVFLEVQQASALVIFNPSCA